MPEKRKPGRPKGSTTKRKEAVLELIQAQVYRKYGIEEWHPIVEMALYAADPNRVLVLRDDDGNIEYDKNDLPIVLESIDPIIRQRCLETVAQYVAPKLKSIEQTPAAMGERFTLNYVRTINGELEDAQ